MLSAFLAYCNLQHVTANAVIELNFFRRELADVDPRHHAMPADTSSLRSWRLHRAAAAKRFSSRHHELFHHPRHRGRGLRRNAGCKWDILAVDFPPVESASGPARPLEIGTRVVDVNDAVRWIWKYPQLLAENVKGFNVVGYRNSVIAIPQTEGAFDQRRVDRCGYSAVYIGKSVPEVVQAVKAARR